MYTLYERREMTAAIDLEKVRKAKAKMLALLKGNPHVVGVGIGYSKTGSYVVKVNLSTDDGASAVLKTCDGIEVVVEVVGTVTPLLDTASESP